MCLFSSGPGRRARMIRRRRNGVKETSTAGESPDANQSVRLSATSTSPPRPLPAAGTDIDQAPDPQVAISINTPSTNLHQPEVAYTPTRTTSKLPVLASETIPTNVNVSSSTSLTGRGSSQLRIPLTSLQAPGPSCPPTITTCTQDPQPGRLTHKYIPLPIR